MRVGASLASHAVSRAPSVLGALLCVRDSPCACGLGAGGARECLSYIDAVVHILIFCSARRQRTRTRLLLGSLGWVTGLNLTDRGWLTFWNAESDAGRTSTRSGTAYLQYLRGSHVRI